MWPKDYKRKTLHHNIIGENKVHNAYSNKAMATLSLCRVIIKGGFRGGGVMGVATPPPK